MPFEDVAHMSRQPRSSHIHPSAELLDPGQHDRQTSLRHSFRGDTQGLAVRRLAVPRFFAQQLIRVRAAPLVEHPVRMGIQPPLRGTIMGRPIRDAVDGIRQPGIRDPCRQLLQEEAGGCQQLGQVQPCQLALLDHRCSSPV
ncbi:hypothetical protein ACFFX0_03400 [Citricoccus parietis]|uniref:Uncharacterized protein n=1 Tax=Citricoccus parietis TaxID=592307 RepID=A0ABV5FUB3_9MICC